MNGIRNNAKGGGRCKSIKFKIMKEPLDFFREPTRPTSGKLADTWVGASFAIIGGLACLAALIWVMSGIKTLA